MVERWGFILAIGGFILMVAFYKKPPVSKFFTWVFGVGSGLIIAAVWVNLLIDQMMLP